MIKAFQYRIYPGPGQRRKLEATLESCRWLYNFFLAERKYAWEGEGRSVSKFDQCNELIQIKSINDNLRSVYSQVLQNVTEILMSSVGDVFVAADGGHYGKLVVGFNADEVTCIDFTWYNGFDDKLNTIDGMKLVNRYYHPKTLPDWAVKLDWAKSRKVIWG